MPKVRTQIRGVKDAKKSNKNSKEVKVKNPIINEANEEKIQAKAARKAANKFKCGGKMKKK